MTFMGPASGGVEGLFLLLSEFTGLKEQKASL